MRRASVLDDGIVQCTSDVFLSAFFGTRTKQNCVEQHWGRIAARSVRKKSCRAAMKNSGVEQCWRRGVQSSVGQEWCREGLGKGGVEV